MAALTTWDYTALMWQWNDRHDDNKVKPPTEAEYYEMRADLESKGYKLH